MAEQEWDPDVWETTLVRGRLRARCRLCFQVSFTELYYCRRHAQTQKHIDAIAYSRTSSVLAGPSTLSEPSEPSVQASDVSIPDWLRSESPGPVPSSPGISGDAQTRVYQDLLEFTTLSEHTSVQDGYASRLTQALADELFDHYEDIDNIDSGDNMPPSDLPDEPGWDGIEHSDGNDAESDTLFIDNPGHKRARTDTTTVTDGPWFPWPDRITCTLDLFTHLPRSHFSHLQQDLINWLMAVNGMRDVPSVRQLDHLNQYHQKRYGIATNRYEGAFGNIYYMNDLAQIVSQELSNPHVRMHMRFYPENTNGAYVGEAFQAERWLHEAPDDLLTPMVRLKQGDFFVYEPAMIDNGSLCIPTRWFVQDRQIHAWCWKMYAVESYGWRVVKESFDVHMDQFVLNFLELKSEYAEQYNQPSPTLILDIYDPATGQLSAWTYTDPQAGNPWRLRAKGHRVVSIPLWLYCDDISGNISKKWNKHNSYLFTLASLPCEHVHKEYNVHFLSTSNLSPPLEMLEGVVTQIEGIQSTGVWAWDCQYKELILVTLWVLALLGDNPMQSEFAAHIGLRGRLFCRICFVEGKSRVKGSKEADESDDGSDAEEAERATAQESLAAKVSRISAFIQRGVARTAADTVLKLKRLLQSARTIGSLSNIKKQRTTWGLKDTYQMYFLDQLANAYAKARGAQARQTALDQAWAKLPENLISPVWRIKGLDPHCHTPVEVLHVVLLGFVKYLWRDIIHVQSKNKSAKLELLT